MQKQTAIMDSWQPVKKEKIKTLLMIELIRTELCSSEDEYVISVI